MNMHIRRVVLSVTTVALALAFAGINGAAHAQKPLDHVTIIVGYPAGGATDTVARLVAEAIQGKYAAAVVVQNKTGAGGQIAAA
jgi:tripartite-type tricarboxylate transporter receptor subunit TctC